MGVNIDTKSETTVRAIEYPLQKLKIYKVIGQDLEMLKIFSFSKSAYSLVASASWAVFLSFFTIIINVPIEDEWTKIIFTAIACTAFILSIICSIFSIKFYFVFKNKFLNLKSEEVKK